MTLSEGLPKRRHARPEPKKQPGVRSDMQHRQICSGRLPNRGPATAAGEIDNAESLNSVLRIATPGV